MEGLIAFLVLFGLIALIAPILLSITNASRVRTLEGTVKKLSERLNALESGQPKAPTIVPTVIPKEAAPAPTPIPRATPPPLPATVAKPAAPPPVATVPLTSPTPSLPKPERRAIDWEAFMGVKLFAWIGGFVFFLGVVFLVKYSFENNLITPRMRIVIGALIGLALIATGWKATRKNFRVPGQSLCATGILVLYADIFRGSRRFTNSFR